MYVIDLFRYNLRKIFQDSRIAKQQNARLQNSKIKFKQNNNMKITSFLRTLAVITAFLAATLISTSLNKAQAVSWNGNITLNNGNIIAQDITLTGDVVVTVPAGATATIRGVISGNYKFFKMGEGKLIFSVVNGYNWYKDLIIAQGVVECYAMLLPGRMDNSPSTQQAKRTITLSPRTKLILLGDKPDTRTANILDDREIIIEDGFTPYGTIEIHDRVALHGSKITGPGTITVKSGGNFFLKNSTATWDDLGISGNIVLESSSSKLTFENSKILTYPGVISGAGAVTHSGTNQVILSGKNTYTGKTLIDKSLLIINQNGSIWNTSEIELSTATSAVSFNNASELNFTKPITGQGSIQKWNSGKLKLTNARHTGITCAVEGVLCISGNQFPSSGVELKSRLELEIPNGTTMQYDGTIYERGSISKLGGGKLILTGNNTYTGETNVNTGVLQVSSVGNLGSTGVVKLNDASAVLRFDFSTTNTFSKVISGTGKVEKAGTGDLRLTADNTYTGTTTIEKGRLYLGYNTLAGSVAGNIIISGGTLYFQHSSASKTYSGVISGATGYVYHSGTGKTILNGTNTYGGATTISVGTLALGASGSISSSSSVYLNGSTAKFDISAGNKTIKGLQGSNANAEIILGTRTLTIGTSGGTDGGGRYVGKISGTAGASNFAIIKRGSGTLTLEGTSTYSGYTCIREGTVIFNSLNNFGTSNISFTSGTNPVLQWASGNTADISGRLINLSASSITFDIGSNNVTFATALPASTNTVIKAGAGTLTYTAANANTGVTRVTAGTLAISGSGAIAGSSIELSSGASLSVRRNYTYSGVISGAGSLNVGMNGDLSLTGANTYTGTTSVNTSRTLTIGKSGTTGSIASSSISVASGGKVIFTRSNDYTYAGIISGAGGLEQSGTGRLMLNNANTYTGATSISSTGTLELLTGGTIASSSEVNITSTGKFIVSGGGTKTIKSLTTAAGSEVRLNETLLAVNTTLTDNVVNGIISGSAAFTKMGSGTLTLNGANTHTGTIAITGGTLALGASGSLENSMQVNVRGMSSFDVSAGNKTIKALNGTDATCKVLLGARTLTIGTSAATADGSGDFKGVISGSGGIAKTGLQSLILSGNNTATGTFSHSAGNVDLSGKWAGDYFKAAGTSLDVNGSVIIGGSLTLQGGTIAMDLMQEVPSKINVTGAVAASGTNTFEVTSGEVANQVLMEAASGITSTTPYALNMPGLTANLAVNSPTQLLLTATVTDETAPVPGNSGIITSVAAIEAIAITWTAASDNETPASNLRYFVYRSSNNNIRTVAECEANGTLLNHGGTLNITGYNITELTPATRYFFNVMVIDQAGNKAVYSNNNTNTKRAVLKGTALLSGNFVFGDTLRLDLSGLTSEPEIADLGTLTCLWLRDGAGFGFAPATPATPYVLTQADIGHTFSVLILSSNCDSAVLASRTDTVIKAAAVAPVAPVLQSKSHNSITLLDNTGYEYRMAVAADIDSAGVDVDDPELLELIIEELWGEWQETCVFVGLEPEMEYLFQHRTIETATHFVSPASLSLRIATDTAPIVILDKVLQSIIPPSPITGLANGTAKTAGALGLPSTVTLTTDLGNVSASVNWNVAGCTYNPALTTAQSFNVSGTVVLPQGVVNPADVSLTVTVSVSVEAAPLNPRILNVEVSPAAVTVQKGQEFLFTAIVSAVDGADEAVSWSVSGGGAETSISSAGLLIVAAGEIANSLKVKAVSVFNASVFDTATVTLTDAPVPDKVLQSIIVEPDVITGLPNGVAKSAVAFGLPSSVRLVTDGGDVSASVNWDVAACEYDPALPAEQTFDVSGMVILPQGVVNSLDISLEVSIRVSVNAGENVGLSEDVLSGLTVYPNPCASMVFIKNAEGAELKIMDLCGQSVRSIKALSSLQEISVSDLRQGVYLFRLIKDGAVSVVKVMKMN